MNSEREPQRSEAGLDRTIYPELDRLDFSSLEALTTTARSIRERIVSAPLPAAVLAELTAAYRALSQEYGEEATDVAVRSSATAEDLPDASFAGQQETFLNIAGLPALDAAVRACMASLLTDRAITYRATRGFPHREIGLPVGVQKMVQSDLGSAGVIFTLDTESGFRDVVLITGAWGLGETVVQGRVRPDEFWVHKPVLRAGFRSLIRRERRQIGEAGLWRRRCGSGPGDARPGGRSAAAGAECDDEVLTPARWAVAIEEHYSEHAGRPMPMDLEWARDGREGRLYILARPETVHSRVSRPIVEVYRRRGSGRVLLSGRPGDHGFVRRGR
jgi:pyruvate,water dikinase